MPRGRKPRADSSASISSFDSSAEEAETALASSQEKPQSPSVVYPEAHIFKAVADPAQLPLVVIANAVAYEGKQLVNFLTAIKAGGLVLEGQIEVDEDFAEILAKDRNGATLNGARVAVKDITGYSIAQGPVTLWVHSRYACYEVRAGEAYRSIMMEINAGVGIIYNAVDFYPAHMTGSLDSEGEVTAVLERFAGQCSGSGASLDELVRLCRKMAPVIMEQMELESTSLKKTIFYSWLQQACPDLGIGGDFDPLGPSPPSPSASPSAITTLSFSSPPSSLPASASPPLRMNKVHHGDYCSPEFPDGLPVGTGGTIHVTDAALALLHHAKATGRGDYKTISFECVADSMYRDFSLSHRAVGLQLVATFATEIADGLGPEWQDTVLVKALRELDPAATHIKPGSIHEKTLKRVVSKSYQISHRKRTAAHGQINRKNKSQDREQDQDEDQSGKEKASKKQKMSDDAPARPQQQQQQYQRPVSHRDMMIDPVLQALSPPLADQQFQSLPNVAATAYIVDKVNALAAAEDTEDTQMAGTGEEVEDEDEDDLFVPLRHPRMR
ncbi:hypothetical protein MBM_01906 [Drepanopeziza brunnea f. sp. 'multigermtubi' MB_m1]|uniref:Uncharacterized protein n=1 Tax=Marssonina brunnea f. sp. multigermtubi (strain MB_m1) TaxID=1072389 RepID=K1Y443_MARBU|nr:uncharacterized protein MBM_01906 [Drepanopeziza brunnea f. sp. 'multigermtubi' MB_m1]EKD19954.1 hypothetical protein MBM_01906 [Drepanopeziza brunnea f. sp. 'multigermtubi' MB_m1]